MSDCEHEYKPEENYGGEGRDVECAKCGALWVEIAELAKSARHGFLGYIALSVSEALDPKAKAQVIKALSWGVEEEGKHDAEVVKALRLIQALDALSEERRVPGFSVRLTEGQRRKLKQFIDAGSR